MDGPDPAVAVVHTAPPAGGCANCGAVLTGPFCAQCGERVIDPRSLTVRHFLTHTVAHELLHLDGKIWRTLRALIFRPGFLTAEFCAGRRTAYVNPVRLLITAIILYALVMIGGTRVVQRVRSITLSVAPAQVAEGSSIADTVERLDRFGLLQRIVDARAPRWISSPNQCAIGFHESWMRLSRAFSSPGLGSHCGRCNRSGFLHPCRALFNFLDGRHRGTEFTVLFEAAWMQLAGGNHASAST